ncbi:2'-5' RNA ligase [Candidatus Vecturithrix granuli]|uniref:RNA 2',3'-cyclic phosphodiesterase n=1 Tax=Vecturithrix granuli TaxID=1499967 RepID=A0A081C9G6_VECG1|nr:2'-5' RNA ligase [Candidatus Vecturithrix granuli]
MDTIRSFIAIKIPDTIQEKLAGIQEKLKQADAHISWVNSENIHLTLKFLGNIQEKQVADIIAAIKESVQNIAPFQLQIGYAGAFPNIRFPRVIWVGVTDDEQNSLKTLQEDLESRLTRLGFESEQGRFQPHLTLGRVRSQKNRSNLLRAIESMTNVWVGEIPVKAIYLVQSELKPTGSEYTDLAEVKILSVK